jgi:DNA-binding GntR family transcriptional regulator
MKIPRPQSLTALVVEELRARIVDGRLRLGEHLSENALAGELGLSKTPVREALLQLKSEGLVEILPQRGTYVFRLEAGDVEQVSALREILEIEAASTAIRHNYALLVSRMTAVLRTMRAAYHARDKAAYRAVDDEFHRTLIDLCGNSYIKEAYGPIGLRIQALRSRLSDEAALNQLSFRDHCDMLKRIKARDVSGLHRLLRTHIRQTARSYMKVLGRRPAGHGSNETSPSRVLNKPVRRPSGASRSRAEQRGTPRAGGGGRALSSPGKAKPALAGTDFY